jgi:cell division protein FtsN
MYTVQTGSFMHIEEAQKQFESIVQGLPEKYLDYLRIEKIGKYYTVRTGIFENRVSADTFLQTMTSKYPASVIRKAYIKEDRIKKMYRIPSSVNTHKIKKKVIADPKPQKPVLQKNEKSVHQKESQMYTVQTGSFMHIEEAQKLYDAMVQGAITRDLAYNLSYLRIEKTGTYYSVRIGKFKNRVVADALLQALKTRYPDAVMLTDSIKDDRIIKLY